MPRRWSRAVAVAASLVSAACGGEQDLPSPVAATSSPTVAPVPPLPTELERAPLSPIAYGAKQRRDPFKPPVSAALEAKKGPALEGFKLVGVMRGSTGSMALVEGADGIGYILKPGDVIGHGRVTQISSDAVRITVTGPRTARPTEITLRFPAN
jgi:Tfp pilus assembly protein PilP